MSTIKANTLLHSDGSTTNPPAIPALDTRMAQAWVTFKGTTDVTINGSFNCSSVTDVGTGQFTVNFSTALANINYSSSMSTKETTNSAHSSGTDRVICPARVVRNTGHIKVVTQNSSYNVSDCIENDVMIFGN